MLDGQVHYLANYMVQVEELIRSESTTDVTEDAEMLPSPSQDHAASLADAENSIQKPAKSGAESLDSKVLK